MRTQLQKDNLQKLIDGWTNSPLSLYMDQFASDTEEATKATPEHPCSTDCCLVGSGPSYGIPVAAGDIISGGTDFLCHLDWINYAKRVFGFTDVYATRGNWEFCFGSDWDNSIPEAIARLELAQADKIPEDWDYYDTFT